jgi:hypothetical protein
MSFSKTDKTQIAAAPAAARTEHEQTNLRRRIDRLVYDLLKRAIRMRNFPSTRDARRNLQNIT